MIESQNSNKVETNDEISNATLNALFNQIYQELVNYRIKWQQAGTDNFGSNVKKNIYDII